jgi:outer membrane protein OmpA-like peptidoglycan-associated protein
MSKVIFAFKALVGIAGFVMAALALSGCAQKMTSNAAVDEARAAFQTAQADPAVVRNAALELKKAESALGRAEQLLQQQSPVVDIEHQAYLSRQHSAIAQEIGSRKLAEAAIEQASAERNKVLLEARAAEASLARQKAEAERAAASKAQLEAEAQKAAAEKAQTEAAEAREKAARLEQELAELQAVKADRGLVMTLGDVLFDVNMADLKPGGILTVDKLATFLKEYPARRVMIEGFTDSTGTAEYNQGLSERRALAVRQALLDRGVESARIDFKGYGEEFPVATNATAAGRQMNRRVEIIISDEEGVIPARTE